MTWDLVGREDELDTIMRVVPRATTDGAGVLVLRGETGIGKTALLQAALRRAAPAGGLTILRTAGVGSEVELAFSGLHQLLTPVLDLIGGLPDSQAGALRRAIGLDGAAPTPSAATTDLLVCVAVLNLLHLAAVRQPLLVVVDDAQDLDRATLLVLLFAARRLDGQPVGVLIAVRDPDDRAALRVDLPELRLAGLAPEAAGVLLDRYGPAGDVLARPALVRATGGNPLVLIESALAGVLPELLLTGALPLRAALRERFCRQLSFLPPPAATALLVAAAEDTGRLDVVLGACARLGLPADAWELLERSGLVEITGDQIRFAQTLVRSAAYAAAASDHRRTVHSALADQLIGIEPTRAGWHRALATVGFDDALAADLERNAERAARHGGIAATTAMLRQAARLSDRDQDRRRRTAAAAHAAWKSGHPGLARRLLGTVPDVSSARLRGLIELYAGDQHTAYEQLLRAAAVSAPAEAFELLFMTVDAALHAGLMPEAEAAAQRIATLDGDVAMRRYGEWLVATVTDRLGGAAPEPWRVFDAAPEPVRRSGAHRWLFPLAITGRGQYPQQAREFALTAYADLRGNGTLAIAAIPLPWLVELELRLGRWDEATAHAREGLRLARDIGQAARVGDLLALLALLAAARGDNADCLQLARAAVDAAAPLRNQFAVAQATWALGALDLARGEHERAAYQLTGLHSPGSPQAHPQVARLAFADTVEALVRSGDHSAAAVLTERFAARTADDSSPWANQHLHRARGLLTGDGAHYQRALSAANLADRPFDRARIALLYGQWLRRERRPREAATALRLSTELFTTLGALCWAETARGELRATAAAAAPPVSAPTTPLTAQELRVAALAGAGLSNREIGARLYLSHRTVGYHLHKVFAKLGISARSQLRDLVPAHELR
ncbi:AAA family ATPase [Micromonospora arborensis]|uniref:AAA family ATPase n=1 Tax=Micromonospora arborensis TaxID=2116518 RepID=UPI0034231ACE